MAQNCMPSAYRESAQYENYCSKRAAHNQTPEEHGPHIAFIAFSDIVHVVPRISDKTSDMIYL